MSVSPFNASCVPVSNDQACLLTGGFGIDCVLFRDDWCLCAQGADSPFMKAFYDKGRVSGLLKSIPIYAVLEEDIGLRGAHFVAFRVSSRMTPLSRKYDFQHK